MEPRLSFPIWIVLLIRAITVVASDPLGDFLPRAVPRACKTPVAVSLAYDVLSILHATQFCTQWLGIKTVTVSETQTATIVASTTTTTTITSTDLTTTTMTTITTATTVLPLTVNAPTVTRTVPTSITVFSPVTATSTSTSTSTSTTTIYDFDVESKKRVRRSSKPSKPGRMRFVADNIVSSACSCLATVPTVTAISSTSTTSTLQIIETSSTIVTSIISTATEVDISIVTSTDLTTITPTTIITNTATLTSPTTVATQTTTVTTTTTQTVFVSVILIPIALNGCTVQTYLQKFSNIGGGTNTGSSQFCAQKCIDAGKTTCDDFFTQQNLPSGGWDCFLLTVAQELNTNFVCGNPNIGQAFEWIIIY